MIGTFLFFLLFAILLLAMFFVLYRVLPFFLSRYNPKDKKIASLSKEELFSKEEKDISYLTVENPLDAPYKAVVRCSNKRNVAMRDFVYEGEKDCRLFKYQFESASFCKWGCIGFGTCVSFCAKDAITIQNGTATINNNCIGCGACLDSCPNQLIELVARTQTKEDLPCKAVLRMLERKKEISILQYQKEENLCKKNCSAFDTNGAHLTQS